MRRSRLASRSSRALAAVTAAVVVALVAGPAPAARADTQPEIVVGDTAVVEGPNGSTTSAVFIVKVSQASPNPVIIDYATTIGSARSPGDYVASAGTIVIPPGASSMPVPVTVKGDSRAEVDENFYLRIYSPTGAANPDAYGEARIIDDDPPPYVSIGDATVTEGDTGTVAATFPVRLSAPSSRAAQVRYSTAGGSAGSDLDFASVHSTLTIPAGQTAATIVVPVFGDLADESTYEDFTVTIFAPLDALLSGRATGFGTIVDDDLTVLASVLDAAVTEGSAGSGAEAVFQVGLDRASTSPVVVAYATVGESALGGTDYVAQYGSVRFDPGETTKQVRVALIGDAVDEADIESFRLSISNLSGATVTGGDARAHVLDDDPAPVPLPTFLSVQPTSGVEGDTGTTNATFRVVLQPAATSTVTVNYSTGLGNATPGSDYTSTSGTLTFTAGQTSRNVVVPVLGDASYEADESFALMLNTPTGGAAIAHGQADAVIRENDVAPVLYVDAPVVVEGNTGSADAAFVVSLSGPAKGAVTLTVTALGIPYPVSFPVGTTSQTVHVPVPADTIDENDQTLRVDLSAITGGPRVYYFVVDGVVVDDDHIPWVSLDDTSVPEGDADPSPATFTVSLTAPSPNPVSVTYVTGTYSGGPIEGTDYLAASGTVTFAPGEATKTITVQAVGDIDDENDEYFNLFLGSPTGAQILDGWGTGRIVDDDTLPILSLDDPRVVEGDTGTTTLTFRVSLAPPSTLAVTANFASGTPAGPSATPGVDYTPVTGTVTFAPGDTEEEFVVSVTGDRVNEGTEPFYAQLTGPTNARIHDAYGDATIVDDDNSSGLSVRDAAVYEGNSGTTTARFVVSLAPPSEIPVSVDYSTVNVTAVAPSDYVATNGTLTFAPGETTKEVPVTVNGDTAYEQDFGEGFRLALTNIVGGMLAGADSGYLAPFPTATIINDDAPAQPDLHVLMANDTGVDEGDAGTVDAVFTINLQPPSASTVTVNYTTVSFSAVSGSDFDPRRGTLTFAPGQTSKTVRVPVRGDRVVDPAEHFGLTIHGAFGSSIGRGRGEAFIFDDDLTRSVTVVSHPVVFEGDDGAPTADFTVRISSPSLDPIRLDWYTQDVSARFGEDYDKQVGTIELAPGETERVVSIPVYGDTVVEGEESFQLWLDPYSFVGLDFTTLRGTAIVRDDDTSALLGNVTSPTGAAQSGVTITRSGGGMPDAVVTTATDGRFTFEDVPNGRYVLTASKSGSTFAPASMTVDVRSRSIPSLTFILLRSPSISGRVVDNLGRPVLGVTVTRTGGGQAAATAITNGQGYYGFSLNPAGTYTITPSRPGMTFTPATRSVSVGPASATGVDFTRS